MSIYHFFLSLIGAGLLFTAMKSHRPLSSILAPQLFCVLSGFFFYCLYYQMIFQDNMWAVHIALLTVLLLCIPCFYRNHIRVGITMICIFFSTNFQVGCLTGALWDVCPDFLLSAIYGVSIFSLVWFLKHFEVKNPKVIPLSYCVTAIFPSVVSELCLTILLPSHVSSEYLYLYNTVICIGFAGINLLIYYLFSVITAEHQRQLNTNLILQKTALDNELLHKNELLYQDLRNLHHKLHSHIFHMKSLLDQQHYGELNQYFDKLYTQDFPLIYHYDTGNITVNTILNQKFSFAQLYQIPMEIDAVLPANLPMEETDLCSLLSNLMDNAIDASLKEPSPYLRVQLKTHHDYLLIKTQNRMEKNVLLDNPTLQTTKYRLTDHGVGLRIIRAITQKYCGEMNYEYVNGYFTVNLMLTMNGEYDECL